MKRVTALVLSVIMCLSIGMTAFAVESPEKKAEMNIDGEMVELKTYPMPGSVQDQMLMRTYRFLEEWEKIPADKQIVPIYNRTIFGDEEQAVPFPEEDRTEVTFYLPGLVKADSQVYVSHLFQPNMLDIMTETAEEGLVKAHLKLNSDNADIEQHIVIYVVADKPTEETPSAPDKKAETTINGTVVTLEQVETLKPEQVEASKKATLESKKNEIAANKQLVPVYSENIELPEGVEMPAEGIDITFYLPGLVKADSKVHVSHGKEDGTWENIAATAGEGTVTAHFTSLSPVVIYVEADKAAEETPSTPSTPSAPSTPAEPSAPSATSPKTADADMALAAGMAAFFFVAAAAAGVQVKKNR